jgi:hypothetical protein
MLLADPVAVPSLVDFARADPFTLHERGPRRHVVRAGPEVRVLVVVLRAGRRPRPALPPVEPECVEKAVSAADIPERSGPSPISDVASGTDDSEATHPSASRNLSSVKIAADAGRSNPCLLCFERQHLTNHPGFPEQTPIKGRTVGDEHRSLLSTLSARRMASSPLRGPSCRRCPRSPERPSAP